MFLDKKTSENIYNNSSLAKTLQNIVSVSKPPQAQILPPVIYFVSFDLFLGNGFVPGLDKLIYQAVRLARSIPSSRRHGSLLL